MNRLWIICAMSLCLTACNNSRTIAIETASSNYSTTEPLPSELEYTDTNTEDPAVPAEITYSAESVLISQVTYAPIETEPPLDFEPAVIETEALPTPADKPISPVTTDRAYVDEKLAFLTFDDGPHSENTPKLLEILDNYGIPATFFTVGQRIERCPDELIAISDSGHAVGCHSYDHEYSRVKSVDGIAAEISEWEQCAYEVLGYIPEARIFRFPGGSTRSDELRCAVAELGYYGYDWNCTNSDCALASRPDEMSEEEWLDQSFTDSFEYGSSLRGAPLIILLHETYTQTVEQLPQIIEFLLDEGYSFASLDSLDGSWYF